MCTLRIVVHSLSLALLVLAIVVSAWSQTGVNVTTWHNDNGRTGQNTQENHFYTSGSNQLSKNNFGVLCNFPTQGQVYAEPLVMAHTNDNGMDVYVADMQDYLYKFTIPGSWSGSCSAIVAASPSPVNLLPTGEFPVPCRDIGSTHCLTIDPTVGVLSTPVIDPNTNTLYLVAESEDGMANFYHRLHAIDLTSFPNEKYHGPVAFPSETVNNATFISRELLQRPALLLTHEEPVPSYPTIYIAFSMMDDSTAFPSGWIYAFDAQDLIAGTPFPLYYALAPDTTSPFAGAGVWQGGAGLAAGPDQNGGNFLYFSTANGYFDLNSGTRDSADSFLKFQTNLQPPSGTYYFSPADQFWRQCHDLDYGSAGTLLIPDSLFSAKYAVKADKEDYLWVVDRTGPGGYTGSCLGGTYCDNTCRPGCIPCGAANNLPESPIQFGTYDIHHGPFARATPAFWSGSSASGDLGELYYAAPQGQMSRYPVISLISSCPILTGGSPPVCNAVKITTLSPSTGDLLGYSATPSVSSNGTGTNNNGIVWAIHSSSDPLGGNTAILYAFDANTLNMLYGSNQCTSRDNSKLGSGEKFTVPTIANGYVFVGTQSNLVIFGNTSTSCN